MALIKLVSAFAGAFAAVYALRIFRVYPELGTWPALAYLVAGYLAVEHHQILWGMAGMETQIATTVLLASFCYARGGRPVALGVALGLCLLARPDFALWVAIVGLSLAVAAIRKRSWSGFIRTAGVAAAIYLPWVVFTTWYYGSPVPNTIVAKTVSGTPLPTTFSELVIALYRDAAWKLFAPLGPVFGGNGFAFLNLVPFGFVSKVMLLFLLIGMVTATRRRQGGLLLLYAFFAAYTAYYLLIVPSIAGWYCVPMAAATILLCVKGIGDALGWIRQSRLQLAAGWTAAAAYVGTFAVFLPVTFAEEKGIQQAIENGVRAEVGRFLNQQVAPQETIGWEPLGYIGYYSRRAVYDYPGLASRKAVSFLKAHPEKRHLPAMLEHFRPDYAVLRSHELDVLAATPDNSWLTGDYEILKRFEMDLSQGALLRFAAANADRAFVVLRKKKPHQSAHLGPSTAFLPALSSGDIIRFKGVRHHENRMGPEAPG